MQHDKATLLSQLATLFPDNNSGQITPERVRNFLTNVLDSSHLKSEVVIASGEYVNVKDYGAVGNGIAEEQNAFNAALATHKNVFVPAGEYLIKGDLSIFPNQRFVGSGVGTHLEFSGAAFYQDKCLLPSEGSYIGYMMLSNADSNPDTIIVSLENSKVILDSLLISSPGHGIHIRNTGSTAFSNQILNCTIFDCVTGLFIDRDNTAKAVVQNCMFFDNDISFDLHCFLADFIACTLLGDLLICLRNDNITANPAIAFTKCEFVSTGAGIKSEIGNTSYVLTFLDCKVDSPLRMAQDITAIVQFLRCDIVKLSNEIVSNEVTVRFTDNVLHSDVSELIIPDVYIKSIDNNVVYDSGASKYILKQNNL